MSDFFQDQGMEGKAAIPPTRAPWRAACPASSGAVQNPANASRESQTAGKRSSHKYPNTFQRTRQKCEFHFDHIPILIYPKYKLWKDTFWCEKSIATWSEKSILLRQIFLMVKRSTLCIWHDKYLVSLGQVLFSPILRQQAQRIFRNLEFRREILLEFRKKFLSLEENFWDFFEFLKSLL